MVIVAALIVGWARGQTPHEVVDEFPEYEVKAAWILNFIKFTDWPSQAFASAKEPIRLGLVGPESVIEPIRRILRDKTAKGRSLVIEAVSPDQAAMDCHVLFVAGADKRPPRDWLQPISQRPVLTIGEAEEFTQAGGILRFLQKDKKVRFHINLDGANPTGLKISPKLLIIAHSVQGKHRSINAKSFDDEPNP